MADSVSRSASFKAASLILAQDANIMAQKLKHFIGKGDYERAEGLAARLQSTARDTKWLLQRQAKARS